MKNNKLLSGVKVIELSTYVAASTCGRQLSALGADVIKVESGIGDSFRFFGLSHRMPANDFENPLWDMTNGDKRSLVLDLRQQEGQTIMYRLLENADVFLTNNRHAALKKMGLDYETIKDRFPRLIYATITGFGDLGPERNRPGFDGAAFWAKSGFLADMAVKTEGSYPVSASSGFGDISTGNVLLSGITAALYSREKTGHGDYVSASLYGTALWCVSVTAVPTQEKYGKQYPQGRYEISPAPFQTKDGEWILPIIAVGYPKYFPLLCKAVEREDLVEDPRFKTISDYAKPSNKEAFIRIMSEEFAKRDIAEWAERLEKLDVVYEVLSHFKDIFSDEQALANYYIQDHEMPNGSTCRIIAPPLSSEQNGIVHVCTAPRLGEHTEEILKELGYTAEQIQEMANLKLVKCWSEKK